MSFWTKFAEKRGFRSKTEKNEQHHRILHIQVSLCTKFQLKLIILIFFFFYQICPKREFPVENGKRHLCVRSFRTGTDRHNDLLMSLLLLVAETKSAVKKQFFKKNLRLLIFWKLEHVYVFSATLNLSFQRFNFTYKTLISGERERERERERESNFS